MKLSNKFFILLICLIGDHLVRQASCIVGVKCDHDKYEGGCYSQSNLECDEETNLCVCSSITPILINGRFCVKRAKVYESCQYSDQCDIERGIQCYQTDTAEPFEPLKECDPATSTKCRCLPSPGPANNDTNSKLISSQVNNQNRPQYLPPAHRASDRGVISGVRSHYHARPNLVLQHSEHDDEILKQQHLYGSSSSSSPNHSNTSNIFTRIIWLFLIISLFLLVLLLFVIRYHSTFRESERPLQRATEDRISICSEPDVPPPYEVAIRMKT